jgi:hypothetical protein
LLKQAQLSDFPEKVCVADFHDVTAENLASLPQHSDVILAVLFQHSLVMEHSAFLLFVPRQESFSLGTTHVVIPTVTLIGYRTDIVKIRLPVKIMGYQDFVAARPKFSGNLRRGIARYEALYTNVKCCTRMHKTFKIFIIISGNQFKKYGSVKYKLRVERPGVVRHGHDLGAPRSRSAQIS